VNRTTDQGSCEPIVNSELPVLTGDWMADQGSCELIFNWVSCADLWLQVNSTADQGSCQLIVDSIQLESSPSVLSSIETVTNLVLLVLPSVQRSTKSQKVDRESAVNHTVCVQATNINAFLCCENSGQWIITASVVTVYIWCCWLAILFVIHVKFWYLYYGLWLLLEGVRYQPHMTMSQYSSFSFEWTQYDQLSQQ